MLATIRSLSRIRSSRMFLNNFSSTARLNSEYEPVNDLGFRNHYSPNENEKILSAINQCSPLEMKNFNIAQFRLSKIIQRRENFGEFKSVEELLEIEGFGIKILEKFCDSILKTDLKQDASSTSHQELMLNQRSAKKDPFVSPPLLETVRHRINSIVSFHIDLNFFAWTKICYLPNNEDEKFYVEEWYCYDLDNIDKRINLSTMSQLLVRLIEHIPKADAYVIEAMPMVNTTGGGPAQVVVNVQKAQFYAMLCALMSARKSVKPTDETSQEMYLDSVFFLRTFLASRFYKYLIGGEKVASEQVVNMIFDYNESLNHSESIPKLESIDVPMKLKDYYKSSRPIEKEYLGNSLLVGLTFMKLCVQKCGNCIESLKVRK